MSGRETVKKTICFKKPKRLAKSLPAPYGSDFASWGPSPSPDARCQKGTDEWGAVWDNIGVCSLGEVKKFPLKDWSDLDSLHIPDVTEPSRWENIEQARDRAKDRFLIGSGFSIYERLHFLRGLENTWADIYEHPKQLCRLMDILTDMNLYAIEQYEKHDFDGYMFCDDWGLQTAMMISPEHFRKLWKPRYAKIYQAAHRAGMLTFLHSCGHIVEILDDLIDAGLDVIQMDQQQNMGLSLLSERFAGRITFYCPADIQGVMVYGDEEDIKAYCRRMVSLLGTKRGGFIAGYYGSPESVGHTKPAILAMCESFMTISEEIANGTFTFQS